MTMITSQILKFEFMENTKIEISREWNNFFFL